MTVVDDAGTAPAVAGIIERTLARLKASSPETKALEIRWPENIGRVSILIRATRAIRMLNPEFVLPAGDIVNVELRGLNSFEDYTHLLTSQSDGIHLDISRLNPGEESALLNVDYHFANRKFVESLVSTYAKADIVGTEDVDSYWMEAALRNPGGLEAAYKTVNLRDLQVTVNVGIFEKVLAAIPPSLIRRFDTLREALSESERGQRFRDLMRYHQQRTSASSSDDFSKFASLRGVFSTNVFRKFIDVDEPFRYKSAKPSEFGRGAVDLFELPKFVLVESRVNLSLKEGEQAREGYLRYSARDLRDHLHTLLGGRRPLDQAADDAPPDTKSAE